MIVAMRVTASGKKDMLGVVESTTENSAKATVLLEEISCGGLCL